MYQPTPFREERLDVQHALIEQHSFGLLISSGPEGLFASGLPFLLQRAAGQFGTLQLHLARANPQWKNLDDQNVLTVFQGPFAYISPSWYETKRETGKVVPTWNYAMVQARGVAKVHDNPDWLDQQIEAITNKHELEQAHPWAVSDAPRSYIESQLRGIVGVEIEIAAIEGKWKASQNRPEADRRGVAEGLGTEHADMVELVKRYGQI